MEHLSAETFKEKVFDYSKGGDWDYKGERPAIIDFYADWCGPCKMVAPVLEQLAKEYAGKVDIYKVNTEEEAELSGAFGIMSIPSLLFIPKDGKPQMSQGAMPKAAFEQAIQSVFNISKN